MPDPFAQYAVKSDGAGDDPFAQYAAPATPPSAPGFLDYLGGEAKGFLKGLNPIQALHDLIINGPKAKRAGEQEWVDQAEGKKPIPHDYGMSNVWDLLSDPESVGQVLGNVVLGKGIDVAAPKVAAMVPPAERVLGATGRGLERIGAATKHPIVTTATMGAPVIAEATGRGLQRMGKAVEGMKRTRAGVDPYMPNTPAAASTEFAPSAEGAGMEGRPVIDPHMPNRSAAPTTEFAPSAEGVGVDGPPPAIESPLELAGRKQIATAEHRQAELENIQHNAPYGEGGIMPSSMLPTEYRDAAMEGLNGSSRLDAAVEGLSGETSPAGPVSPEAFAQAERAAQTSTGGKALPNMTSSETVDLDKFWGPDARTLEKVPAQAAPMKGEPGYLKDADPSHQIYDPTTDMDYIRQLRDAATTAKEQAYYSRILDQRNRIGLSLEGLGRPSTDFRILRVKPFVRPNP